MAAIALVPTAAVDVLRHRRTSRCVVGLRRTGYFRPEQQLLADFKAALTSAADKRDRVAHRLARLENQAGLRRRRDQAPAGIQKAR
jgi:hypothetical protein